MDSGEPVRILRVALPVPFFHLFDYLPPASVLAETVPKASRVRVPFGSRQLQGLVVKHATASDVPQHRLRRVDAVIDSQALVSTKWLDLVAWAADYYQYPIGEAIASVLPQLLRRGREVKRPRPDRYCLTCDGYKATGRTVAQENLLCRFRENGTAGLRYRSLESGDRTRLTRFLEKGWVRPIQANEPFRRLSSLTLNSDQKLAVDAVLGSHDQFSPWLLEGITGSGKTRVYLTLIRHLLSERKQALVLVPEIALTPQMLAGLEQELGVSVDAYHSGLAEGEKLRTWARARRGEAQVIVGTRSAIFLPLRRPGLFIVDESHDPSYKQQDGFRYHGRDVAVYRARQACIPVILGTATPTLETLYNCELHRYQHLKLSKRAGQAQPPAMRILDIRGQLIRGGLSDPLLTMARKHLNAGSQVLFFLNRRGFAPVMLCHLCGEPLQCPRCSARLVWHASRNKLVCHHCGTDRALPESCPNCRSENCWLPLGKGTERLEAVLLDEFPDYAISRIDGDATRSKGRLQSLLSRATVGDSRILIGTQILAKGHNFPNLTFVAVVDADQGLFSVDFRAPERMAQLITQVAGRAGRGDQRGEVAIQTRHPDHSSLKALLRGGYSTFALEAMTERQQAGWPPFGYLALLRAESVSKMAPESFLDTVRSECGKLSPGVTILGPVAAPLERRAGRYRMQLLLSSEKRSKLQQFLRILAPRLATIAGSRRVRYSIDVDPVDLA